MIEVDLWNTPEEAALVRREWDQECERQEPVVGYRAAFGLSRPTELTFLMAVIDHAYVLIQEKGPAPTHEYLSPEGERG